MRPPSLCLVDVSDPILSAFLEWASAQEVEVAVLRSASLSAASIASTSLVVAAVDDEEAATTERIRAIRKCLRGSPIVVVARGICIDSVASLMRAGVTDVIGLDAPPADVVARAVLHAAPSLPAGALVGHSPAMRLLGREIAAVAPMRSTVLITGETGVGKGVVARLIHQLSAHSDRPFVHVDCAALAPSLIESELFGHERGAFTSAVGERKGRFELAQDGTVFLDEVGDLEASVQTKLLRVLQDREYERLGSSRTRVLTARVIAATNRDLRAAVAAGRFRADLFFRLNVFRLHVPPLRERRSDVPELARYVVQQIAHRLELPVPHLSELFYERLCSYDWPGNVRELMNVLERALIRHRVDAGEELELSGVGVEDREESADEKERIEAALSAAGGNISRAARRLGLPRSTLRYKIFQNDLGYLIPRD